MEDTFEELKSKYWREYLNEEKNDMNDKSAFHAFVCFKIMQETKKIADSIKKDKP